MASPPRPRAASRSELTTEIARPVFGSVRSPTTGYPADGLTPDRLAVILREADAGYPVRYLELIEFMEERDPHFAGVMGTRRRSVAQLPLGVEAFSDDPAHEARAEEVRSWLKRGVVQRALFDILDCLPKGFSISEILWEAAATGWRPAKIIRRDPRWFRFDRADLETPLMLGPTGGELPLPPGKFIYARIGAKSGLPLRSGLGRIALWSYLFKQFTQRDWQIFIQTYGQPLRIGKYGPGTSAEDRDTLFKAVANIAGDCAAIIPDSMVMEFVETGQLTASGELYERRADWIDKQVSKLILGQTATTDAVTGGLGSGKEHRQVQEDIERADAAELSAILTEQLIHPWARLNGYDPDEAPQFTLTRPEEEDLEAFGRALTPFIDRGLRVPLKAVRDKFGLPEPEGDEAVLTPVGGGGNPPEGAPEDGGTDPSAAGSPLKRDSGVFKRGAPLGRGKTAPGGDGPQRPKNGGVLTMSAEGPPEGPTVARRIADRTEAEALSVMAATMARLEAMVASAGSLAELRAMIDAGFDDADARAMAGVLAQSFLAAGLAGRVEADGEAT